MTTETVMSATEAAHNFIAANHLAAHHIQVHGGFGKGYNSETGEWDLPKLPHVTIGLNSAAEFVAWFRAVGVDSVSLGRREADTTVNARARHGGILWSFWGSLDRPVGGWRQVPVKVKWGADGSPRNEADVTVDEFEALASILDRGQG
jgi:hypothetical protein